MTNDSNVAIVGSDTDGDGSSLSGFRVDDDGSLSSTTGADGDPGLMFLATDPDGDHVYVVNRHEEGGEVVAYAVDRDGDALSRLNATPTVGGGTPCYCSVDATDRCVLTAQYVGGTVGVFHIDEDGRVGDPTAVVEHDGSGPNENRQSEPHPHSIHPGPDNEYAYAPDLGADRIFVYDFDPESGTLEAADCGHVDVHAGAGPRHMDFHPNGQYAYLINELDSTIVAFERDPDTGALDAVGSVTTLPDDFDGENYLADIHVHPSGKYAYGSNRGHDSIAVYALDSDGRPSLIETESTRGERPRNFGIDPTGAFLFAENARSDSIVTFRIAEDGTLDPTGHETTVPSPVCMQFVEK